MQQRQSFSSNMTCFNKNKAVFVMLWGLLIVLLGTSNAQNNQDCCLSYAKKPLPRNAVIGFTEQLSSEVCDISAVIFYTRKGWKICANPKEIWVKKHLQRLSIKLQKLSQLHHF